MNIVVTGASGFVGINLIPYLKEFNHNIFELTRTKSFTYSDISTDFLNQKNINAFIHLAGKAHDLKKIIESTEYYDINTDLTINLYDKFLNSDVETFIYFSSIKAVTDSSDIIITEEINPNPFTHYGKSKLLAEKYINSCVLPESKRVYILRPCMIHGPANKGNLNQLYKLVSKGIPWPLGKFENKRSFCSIDNLMHIIKELVEHNDIPSGIYNIADDDSLSTNEIINLIASSNNTKSYIWNIPESFIKIVAKIGDKLNLSLNTSSLQKLTDSFEVSNNKIKSVLRKPLPISSKTGLLKTFQSFKGNDTNI